jgi:hypothetical protein
VIRAARCTVLLLALAPTGSAAEDATEADVTALPAQLSATVVIEPPRIEVGDAFAVEIAVVTPPEHQVPAAPVPKSIEGLWILDAERPALDRQPGRWIHRQRFRARARAVGSFSWPALELPVEGPDGSRHPLAVPARPFTVVSLLAEHPEQRTFFSYREPPPGDAARSGPWLPAMVGALFALGAVGLASWVRRARAGGAPFTPGGALPPPPGHTARALEALRHAAARAADPVHAADLAAVALRDWAAERGRCPELRTATAEELAARPPPPALADRYDGFVALVRALDAQRFPPLGPDAEARTRDAIGRTLAWVAGAGTAA